MRNIVYPSKSTPRHRDSPKPAIVENATHSAVTISATKIVLTRDCAKEVLVSTWIKLSSVGCSVNSETVDSVSDLGFSAVPIMDRTGKLAAAQKKIRSA